MTPTGDVDRPPPPAREALTLDLGRRHVPRLLVAGVVAVALGLGVAVLFVNAIADPGEDVGPAWGGLGVVIGAAIVVFGLFCLWAAHRGTGARLVLDDDGLHWEAPSRAWDLRWDDLEAVGLAITVWTPPRMTASVGRGQRTGRIVLLPHDPADPALQGALRHLRTDDVTGRWTHWVALGTSQDWIAAADDALGRLAGARYAGISERETLRRRYS